MKTLMRLISRRGERHALHADQETLAAPTERALPEVPLEQGESSGLALSNAELIAHLLRGQHLIGGDFVTLTPRVVRRAQGDQVEVSITRAVFATASDTTERVRLALSTEPQPEPATTTETGTR